MSVKIKVTVDLNPESPPWTRHTTFFVKISNRLYNNILYICSHDGITFQKFFIDAVEQGLERAKTGEI